MRYPDGGGLTAEGRTRRKKVRLQAAQLFAQDMNAGQIAGLLRMSTKSVYQLAVTVRSRLRSIQHRPSLISGFLGQTGLALEPGRPQ
jgi:hypothetical protein